MAIITVCRQSRGSACVPLRGASRHCTGGSTNTYQ